MSSLYWLELDAAFITGWAWFKIVVEQPKIVTSLPLFINNLSVSVRQMWKVSFRSNVCYLVEYLDPI